MTLCMSYADILAEGHGTSICEIHVVRFPARLKSGMLDNVLLFQVSTTSQYFLMPFLYHNTGWARRPCAPVERRIQFTVEITMNKCTVLRRECTFGGCLDYWTEVTYATCSVLCRGLPTSSTVLHPSCTGAQGLLCSPCICDALLS